MISSKKDKLSPEKFQEFLDTNQYTLESITNYEVIFGKKFVSTGGKATTEEFSGRLQLKPGEYVLDVGCGLGGSDFYMAETYQAKVLGVDLSTNMIQKANQYREEMQDSLKQNVEFKIEDVTKMNYLENTFDCIYSRECLIYIENKEELFSKFWKWLKPGGRLLFSDYCLGPNGERSPSKDFQNYLNTRGYNMRSIDWHVQLLLQIGFKQVQGEDLTQKCKEILKADNDRFLRDKSKIIEKITRKEYDIIVSSWENKLQRCINGEQSWGLFYAIKV